MTNFIFPNTFYWQFRAPNAQEFIDKISATAIEENIDNSQFSWGKECVIDRIPLKWEDWLPLVEPSIKLLGKQLGKQFQFWMYDPWINYYNRGAYQEVHDHIEQDLACVFFANYGEGFSDFTFMDRYNATLSSQAKKLIDYHNVWGIRYAPGDIIFFPGTCLHQVTQHKSDTVRQTFACNFKLDVYTE